MSEPTNPGMTARECLLAMRDGFEKAIIHGGPNASVHCGDLLKLINAVLMQPAAASPEDATNG